MGTFKVYLTEEQWARVCENDEEMAAEVAKQQPEMFLRLNPAKAQGHTIGTSPVADKNVAEAMAQIGNMRSKEKLQQIIDHDQRVTVREAAGKRLAEADNA